MLDEVSELSVTDNRRTNVTDNQITCVICGGTFIARHGAKTCRAKCRQSAASGSRACSSDELKSFMDRLASHGYLEYKTFFPAELLASVNRKIDMSRASRPGFENFIAEDIKEIVNELRAFPAFEKIEARAREATFSAHTTFPELAGPPEKDGSFYVLRCVDAKSDSVSHKRHYDSHLMTILVLLQTSPDEDENGDLVIYPNHRRVPGSFLNVLQKLGTKIHQMMPVEMRKKLTRADLRSGWAVRVRAVAGDVYVFNGLVSMHCNFNVRQGERRSLLIHDYDPKLAFGITDIFRSLRLKSSSTRRLKPLP